MRGTGVALALLSFGSTSSESTPEAPDFNVANALLKHDIDIATIPALSGSLFPSYPRGAVCSIAVRPPLYPLPYLPI